MADILRFLSWYLVIFLIGWIGFPIIFRFLPHLPSRGYALARALGFLIWGYIFWLCCSLGILQNNLGGVLLALIVLVAISMLSCTKGIGQEILTWVKENKRTIITMEVLFFLFFAIWAVVRAANPDVTYTEKPMELAFINSILKSPSFPPQDPWLSGYAISYYYFGYVLISMLIRLTGVASSVAFNLSSALWFGLTALAVYGIVFDLLASGRIKAGHQKADHHTWARAGAWLGPLFVLILSCLEGALEFLYSWGLFWKADAQGTLTSKFWSWLAINELNVAPSTPATFFPSRSSGWLWWRGSRVLQDLTVNNTPIEVIDEFPFFSFLLSDLHPHVLAMPFVLLAVGISLNIFLAPGGFLCYAEGSLLKWLKRLVTCWEFWLIALVMGSLAFINTWDFPIYVGLFCLAMVFGRVRQSGWNWTRIWEFIKHGLTVGIAGILLFLPFYLGFSSQAGGLLPSMEFMTRGVHFWILFGVLLIPIVIWLLYQFNPFKKPHRIVHGLKIAFIVFSLFFLISLLFGVLILSADHLAISMQSSSNPRISALGLTLANAVQSFANLHGSSDTGMIALQTVLRRLTAPGTWITLFLMFAVLWVILFGKEEQESSSENTTSEEKSIQMEKPSINKYFVCLLILMGVALTTFPEFFYLRDQFGWRMNTIFKFYFQAWILWGIAAAYVSVDLLSNLRGKRRGIFTTLWILTILGGLAYPTVMLWNKTNSFKPSHWTLDGNAYMQTWHPDDYAAIQWLEDQPLGVVVEAIGGSYSDYARVSTRTGFPTVLGWPGHEGQWRGGYAEVGTRENDIKTLYTTTDWALVKSIIEQYNIRYIYLGLSEANLYATDAEFLKQHLPVVYENSSVTIFEVSDQKGTMTP